MNTRWMLIGLIPLAYLVGSIPFGLLVGYAKGIDVRSAGSGNIGATNVGRLLGGKYFAIVFTLDLLKGLLPTLAGAYVLRHETQDAPTYALWLAIGLAAIVGHMFSLFLKFKGGKGVATSTGVILGVFPYYTLPALAAVAVWIGLFKATRYVSVASIFGAAAFPLAYVSIGLWRGWPVFGRQLPFLLFSILVAALIAYRHRGNISRLRAGTENQITSRSKSVQPNTPDVTS